MFPLPCPHEVTVRSLWEEGHLPAKRSLHQNLTEQDLILDVQPPELWENRFSSVTQSCLTLCDPMNCSMPGLPVHHQLPEFTQTHVHLVGDAIQPSHPLLSPSPPAPNPSQHQGLFQWVNSLHEVAKILEFQPQHSPSSEHPGLISFRMDWLDLLAVQRTLKSLLQHRSSKVSIIWCSAFFKSNSYIHAWPLEKP